MSVIDPTFLDRAKRTLEDSYLIISNLKDYRHQDLLDRIVRQIALLESIPEL